MKSSVNYSMSESVRVSWCTDSCIFLSPPQGTTYDVGDIVSVLDRDGGVYYAIVRGFLQDQYAAKYATLTWLLPTRPNPSYFDPSIFVIGE